MRINDCLNHDYIIPIWNWSQHNFLLPLLFPLLLHYSYMELEPSNPINLQHSLSITLFLYGIGALNKSTTFHVSFYYIIPIWNWSQPSVPAL